MCFEKARISLDYLYNYVKKYTTELRKISKIPRITSYRNLKSITNRVRLGESMEVTELGFSIKMTKNEFAPQKPHENNSTNNRRASNIKKCYCVQIYIVSDIEKSGNQKEKKPKKVSS